MLLIRPGMTAEQFERAVVENDIAIARANDWRIFLPPSLAREAVRLGVWAPDVHCVVKPVPES